MRVVWRKFRTRQNFPNFAALKQEVMAEMDRSVKPALVHAHERVVADWRHKPEFKARKVVNQRGVAVDIYPAGEYKMIWVYVDQGTEPHLIRPKRARRLRFQTGYHPRTSAKPARYGASDGGKATGPVVYASVVHHPGTKARNFTQTIADDMRVDIKRMIENALRRGARKV